MKFGRIIQKEHVKFFEVADNVFAAIVPYNGTCWANAGFINRGGGLVFDTMTDLRQAKELRRTFEEVSGGKSPKIVFNSHYNGDHAWGNQIFEDCSVFVAHENFRNEDDLTVWKYLVKANPMEVPEENRTLVTELQGLDLDDVRWVDADVYLSGNAKIRLGDTKVEFLYYGPAHTDSDMMMWLPEEKVLFAGDIVFNGCVSWNETGLKNWVTVLDHIIDDLKPEIVIPGHGKICGLEFVKEQRDYLASIIDQFNKYYSEDIDILSLAKKIDISKFTNWIDPSRIIVNLTSLMSGKKDMSQNILKIKLQYSKYLEETYGDLMQPWNPMYSWEEE